jgi:hypothetical protein
MSEEKIYKGKNRNYNPKVQKKSQNDYKTNREAIGNVRYEITSIDPKERDIFKANAVICNVSPGELLKAMNRWCDNTQFKKFVIEKEYLEEKETYFII